MSVNGCNGGDEHDDVVVRKAEHGWVVGDENVSDLTSAMVLADLFAADQSDDDDTTAAGSRRRARRAAANGPPARPAPAPRESDSGAHRLPAGPTSPTSRTSRARPARRSGSRSPSPSLSTRSPPGSGSSRRSACSPSGTGSGPARRSTCCARRRGHAAPGSPSSRRTWSRARRTRCSGCRTSCPARCPEPRARAAGSRSLRRGRHAADR